MKKVLLFLLNNRVINQFWILIGNDSFIKKYQSNWSKLKYDKNKSDQENVGFSHSPETQEAIDKLHINLKAKATELKIGKRVLDIGCGTGLYLKDFPENELYGTDLSKELLEAASKVVPTANLYHADYLQYHFKVKFDFIFSISVIEYIPPSKLNAFSQKLANELADNGKVYIQYPHANKKHQLQYSDLSYIHYSPLHLEQVFNNHFHIVDHYHSYDQRDLKGVKRDKTIYDADLPQSFRNGAIIILEKK